MLIAALAVLENFETDKETFINENSKLADPFSANCQSNIEKALKEYFGINSKEQLKQVTQTVKQMQSKANDDLGLVRTQIDRGFRNDKERRKFVFDKLGYTTSWAKASKNNQTELIGLLIKFNNNMDTTLRQNLVENGVSNIRIDAIVEAAEQLHKANITQENMKGTSKIETAKGVAALNEIYAQVMDICHLGQRIFKHDKNKKELYVFSKLVKNQGTTGGKGAKKEESLQG